jgi:kinetochore protein NDC80
MDRRKTLAGLSPSQLNTRQGAGRASLAPGRVIKPNSQAGKLEQAMGRLSLAGGPVQRRSSTYTKAAGVKQDPRPVSDKLFQQNCIRVIITYLAGHGYEHPITPKVGQVT